ncbi:uncharacterized protein M6B38_400015 [Iris pallida]|uniref:Uncharacterized protein n=1 Tax=Iris pallida TaxID=29817 RepID=A0AAX6FTX4_IRIPA|nr:uncharacterized protein M6B38_400015 [Iris pallida]
MCQSIHVHHRYHRARTGVSVAPSNSLSSPSHQCHTPILLCPTHRRQHQSKNKIETNLTHLDGTQLRCACSDPQASGILPHMAVSAEPSFATVGDSSSGRVEAPMSPDHHHQDRTARSSPLFGQSAVPQTRLLPRTPTGSSPPWPAGLLRKTPSVVAGAVRAPPSALGERSAARTPISSADGSLSAFAPPSPHRASPALDLPPPLQPWMISWPYPSCTVGVRHIVPAPSSGAGDAASRLRRRWRAGVTSEHSR